jgi:hypothetical protein
MMALGVRRLKPVLQKTKPMQAGSGATPLWRCQILHPFIAQFSLVQSVSEKFLSVISDILFGRGVRILIKKTNYITHLKTAR